MDSLYPLIIDRLDEYAIITLDSEASIRLWNTGATRLTGYASTEMIGKPFSTLFGVDEIAAGVPDTEIAIARKVGKYYCERYHIRKDKPSILISGFLFCLEDDNGVHIGFTKIFRDVTDEKEIEKQKDDSVGIVSHELKTPITGIKGYAEILTEKLKTTLPHDDESVFKPLSRIISLTDRLNGLVNYLLEVSKSQSAEITLQKEALCLETLIADVIDEVKASTQTGHKIIFSPQGRTMVQADSGRIAQVITNLLTNAIKYSPHERPILIELEQPDGFILFRITDHGMGIPKDQQKMIFKRFARSENVKKMKLPGVGLGLFISSEIIRYHQGRIGLESEENRGSTFWFTLPLHTSLANG